MWEDDQKPDVRGVTKPFIAGRRSFELADLPCMKRCGIAMMSYLSPGKLRNRESIEPARRIPVKYSSSEDCQGARECKHFRNVAIIQS
jgi:hypothetical protein